MPVYSLLVVRACVSLTWPPNEKTDNGGVDAARKSENNLNIAWYVG